MAHNERAPDGPGCLGLVFGLGLLSLFGFGGPAHHGWSGDDHGPAWDDMPPPEFLDELDRTDPVEWDDFPYD
jgi:hypothetical protein